MNPFRDILDTFRLAALLRRLRPDVTLGYTIKPVIYGTGGGGGRGGRGGAGGGGRVGGGFLPLGVGRPAPTRPAPPEGAFLHHSVGPPAGGGFLPQTPTPQKEGRGGGRPPQTTRARPGGGGGA